MRGTVFQTNDLRLNALESNRLFGLHLLKLAQI